MLSIVDKRLFLSTAQVLVLGERLSQDGIEEVLDFFQRDHEIDYSMTVLVAKGVTPREILEMETDMESIPAVYINKTVENTVSRGTVKRIMLIDLIKDIGGSGRQPAIGQISKAGEKKVITEGTAVFSDGKLAGWLNLYETRGYLFAIDKVKSTVVNVPADEGKIAMEIIRSKGKVKVAFENGEPSMLTVKVETQANVGGYEGKGALELAGQSVFSGENSGGGNKKRNHDGAGEDPKRIFQRYIRFWCVCVQIPPSELLVPVIPLIVVIISLSLITVHDFTAFLPILKNGMTPVLNAAFSFITFPFGETVAFLMLFPHVNKKEKLKKIVLLSAAISILLGIILFFRDISVLGSDLMDRATFIPHLTSLLIPGLNVEPLVDINLLIGGGVKISVCIYAAAKALSQIAGIGDHRKLTGAITTFCVVLSIWEYKNVLELFDWAEKVWPYYSIPFQIIVPLLLLLLSLRKKGKPSNAVTES